MIDADIRRTCEVAEAHWMRMRLGYDMLAF